MSSNGQNAAERFEERIRSVEALKRAIKRHGAEKVQERLSVDSATLWRWQNGEAFPNGNNAKRILFAYPLPGGKKARRVVSAWTVPGPRQTCSPPRAVRFVLEDDES